MANAAESVKKITEKSEKARHEFFKKVEKIVKRHGHSAKLMQDIAEQAAQEYNKVFGRLGVHPLLHLKGGKKPPRYIMERDEFWVLYKPPLWQMGGNEETWKRKVEDLVKESSSLQGAQETLLKTENSENVQEWHGLTQGFQFVDLDLPVLQWGFIQRLDVETDGPVVIAKTWRSQRVLQVQMREHIFTKGYMCLVHGRLENCIQHVKAKFAELGSNAATQVMLKHDSENDPFFEWSMSGKWKNRSVRQAETFFRPIAYFHRKEDNTEYTLVYVNILSGITHQIRITMQSVGHPLVSDDRYLPKDQAMADLKWCPRNFLCEVRSDFYDVFGPYKDEERRRFTRISIENPLPKLFQNVLETKLTLIEKLDPSADLHVGCQYWAIGDEQLMNAFPKDSEYRRKVMRWGQRRGIHLDALDRLLLLEKRDIDEILNNYKPPGEKSEETWVCPECMAFNMPSARSALGCTGYLGQECKGMRIVEDENMKLPKGWMNWAGDPTIHMLMIINPKWLEARRRILKHTRPSWEKPPLETAGSPATEDVLLVLEAALVLNGRSGGVGIQEEDLPKVPGLEDIKLPLAEPPEDSNVQRVRLPGKGSYSRWTYTLKGRERVKYVHDFNFKCKRLMQPVICKADPLPPKMFVSKEEKVKQKRDREKRLKEEDEEEKEAAVKEKEELTKKKSQESEAVEEEAAKKKTAWKKLESTSNPGNFYYFDADTGRSTAEKPPDFEEPEPVWERMESKSSRGDFYYYNRDTGESRPDRPPGVEVLNDLPKGGRAEQRRPSNRVEEDLDDEIQWKRMESKTKPGQFYYFNPITGINEIQAPVVTLPWKLLESKTKKGQFYYFNEDTGQNSVDPPPSAKTAKKRPRDADTSGGGETKRGASRGGAVHDDSLPEGWVKRESDKYKGKFYYMNMATGKSSWERPAL